MSLSLLFPLPISTNSTFIFLPIKDYLYIHLGQLFNKARHCHFQRHRFCFLVTEQRYICFYFYLPFFIIAKVLKEDIFFLGFFRVMHIYVICRVLTGGTYSFIYLLGAHMWVWFFFSVLFSSFKSFHYT
ncbi:hypothetical protein GLYMA_10G211751v4 [Glycine max]|nr:hypothetical protein GLYMA_10G211751v4 [Glycine max]KAH1139356.1 hypothetical protein GYH30_028678 [Glycine max]